MKTAPIQKLEPHKKATIREISELMDALPVHDIDTINWPGFNYCPDVRFALAYFPDEIFIKFFVCESVFRADIKEVNGNVYEDSCVEFFVAPGSDNIYYNFEFNAAGICLMGVGTGRPGRSRCDEEIIKQIRIFPSSSVNPVKKTNGLYRWDLTLGISPEIFFMHKIDHFTRGQVLRGNFYKCGDKLEIPHYLTWNPVSTIKPDFHRPEYFGLLNLV